MDAASWARIVSKDGAYRHIKSPSPRVLEILNEANRRKNHIFGGKVSNIYIENICTATETIPPFFKVETVFENKVMRNHHGGVILVGDHLYGHADPGWACQDFKTGTEVWNHRGFGKGAIGYADGMLYCVDEGSGKVR